MSDHGNEHLPTTGEVEGDFAGYSDEHSGSIVEEPSLREELNDDLPF
jgi:hypothetical protein